MVSLDVWHWTIPASVLMNWSRLMPDFNLPANRSNMQQINMIPHTVTSY